jgi:F-type H+-transporting ATPase subunit b
MLSELGIAPNFLIFHITNFLVVLVLLRFLLYQPILGMFERRSERIREGLAEAERVREDAAAERARLEAQLNEERRASQERLREAVARSEEAAEKRLAGANAEAEELLAKARADAEQIRQQALAGLQPEIADLTMRAAAKVLQAEMDRQRHRELIDRFLREELGELA